MREFSEFRACLEACLEQSLSKLRLSEQLSLALRYALFPGGKRIRPLFALCLCKDLGGDTEKLLYPAAALECVHTASLIHDDLPSLDDDDLRRGRPSLHKAFGEATALLAGDFLVPYAFNLIALSQFSTSQKVELMDGLSAAYMEVCDGQQRDILPGGRSRGELLELHAMKTGSLFKAAAEFASIAAGLKQEAKSMAAALGLQIGITFQIYDDYKDVYADTATIGRSPGSDKRNEKSTFFLNRSREEGRRELLEAYAKVEQGFSELEKNLSKRARLEAARSLCEEMFASLKVL